MSAVGAIGVGQAAQLLARNSAPDRPRPAAPAPEEQAFKVSTINQRLASMAAERNGRVVDFKA
jgi:hypothetical protein